MELVVGLVVLGLVGAAVAAYLKKRHDKKIKSPKQSAPGVGVPGEKGLVNKE